MPEDRRKNKSNNNYPNKFVFFCPHRAFLPSQGFTFLALLSSASLLQSALYSHHSCNFCNCRYLNSDQVQLSAKLLCRSCTISSSCQKYPSSSFLLYQPCGRHSCNFCNCHHLDCNPVWLSAKVLCLSHPISFSYQKCPASSFFLQQFVHLSPASLVLVTVPGSQSLFFVWIQSGQPFSSPSKLYCLCAVSPQPPWVTVQKCAHALTWSEIFVLCCPICLEQSPSPC